MASSYSPPPASTDEKSSEDKKVIGIDGDYHHDTEAAVPRARPRSAWFGGKDVGIGPRIGPVLYNSSGSDTEDSSSEILHKQKLAEENATIKYRSCSWQKVRKRPLLSSVVSPHRIVIN